MIWSTKQDLLIEICDVFKQVLNISFHIIH